VNGRLLAAAAVAVLAGGCQDIGYGPPPSRPLVPVLRAEDPRPLRVLFVGNSLTFFNDLPARTAEKAVRDTTLRYPDMQSVVQPGYSLRQHWALGTAAHRIANERWDYVVLQEGSTSILQDGDTTAKYVARFDSLARAHGARTVLYLTWTYGELPLSAQDTVTRTYVRIAHQVDALVAPVGVAWTEVRQLRPDLTLYLPDSVHPSPVGTYLASCVFVAALWRRPPLGLTDTIAFGDTNAVALDSATVTLLASTAWSATIPFLPALLLDAPGAAIRADDGPREPRTARAARRP